MVQGMERRKRWSLIGAVLAGLILLAIPTATSAAGTCAITVTPSTVHVGESFVIHATGFQPNELAIGFGGLDPQGSAALSIGLDENGSLTTTEVAKDFMIGTVRIDLFGQDSGCSTATTLTVLPAVHAPNTDTVTTSAPSHPDAAIPIGLIGVWLAGLVVGWTTSRRRRSRRAG